jgi:hypothetical protein
MDQWSMDKALIQVSAHGRILAPSKSDLRLGIMSSRLLSWSSGNHLPVLPKSWKKMKRPG